MRGRVLKEEFCSDVQLEEDGKTWNFSIQSDDDYDTIRNRLKNHVLLRW